MSPDLDALKRTEAAPAAPRRARAGLVLGVMLGLGALGWAFLLVRRSRIDGKAGTFLMTDC